MILILIAVYLLGVVVSAYLAGRFHDEADAAFSLLWPLILLVWLLYRGLDAIAALGSKHS